MNIRDAILAKLTSSVVPKEVDGVTVYLRPISIDAQLKISDLQMAHNEKVTPAVIADLQRIMIIDTVCDEKGEPVFSEDGWPAVRRSDGKFIAALWTVVNDHNKVAQGAKEEAGNDSGATGSAENESSSPSPSDAGQATSTAAQ